MEGGGKHPPPPSVLHQPKKPSANRLKLRLYDEIYRLPFYSHSLIHILSLPNSHNNSDSIQKNHCDKSHRVIVVLGVILSSRLRPLPCVLQAFTDCLDHQANRLLRMSIRSSQLRLLVMLATEHTVNSL